MAVRLAVPAVIAGDARLDEARAIRRRQRVLVVAGGQMDQARRVRHGELGGPRLDAADHVADERAERLFVQRVRLGTHACTSTASTMPTIAASTAAPLRPSASPAALPSNTTSTFSPTPAPTESIASMVVPRG